MLLSYFVKDGRSVREVKSSQFKGLLQKPAMQKILGRLSDGWITGAALDALWSVESQAYTITFGQWGNDNPDSWHYSQISRCGQNLVLQLNFSNAHDSVYRRLIRPESDNPFITWGHPVSYEHFTMAWARIDIDLASGEALIEEVQNDWIRNALAMKSVAERLEGDVEGSHKLARYLDGARCTPRNLRRYLEVGLMPHVDMWDEAVLAAAIRFLVEEIGIRRIFYHTYKGGTVMKGMDEGDPPRSIYTSLPRRFCFREVEEWPRFLDRPAVGRNGGRGKSERDAVRFNLLDLS